MMVVPFDALASEIVKNGVMSVGAAVDSTALAEFALVGKMSGTETFQTEAALDAELDLLSDRL